MWRAPSGHQTHKRDIISLQPPVNADQPLELGILRLQLGDALFQRMILPLIMALVCHRGTRQFAALVGSPAPLQFKGNKLRHMVYCKHLSPPFKLVCYTQVLKDSHLLPQRSIFSFQLLELPFHIRVI